MRLLLEIKEHPIQSVVKGRTQIKLKGTDKNGRVSAAVAFGFTAENILKSLSKIVGPTSDFEDRSVTIDLHGDWKNGKEYERNGRKYQYRYFEIDQFQFLLGPALELQKIRQDSLAAFHRAEAFRAEGDFRSAYRELLVQAGKTCNMIDEVAEIVDSLDRSVDIPDDFDVVSEEEAVIATPEALALKKLSPELPVEAAMELAAPETESATPELVLEDADEASAIADDDEQVFGDVGEVDAEDAEIKAATEEDREDVLDDEPASLDGEKEVPSEEGPASLTADDAGAELEEAQQAKPAPAPRPFGMRPIGGFGRPMGFGRG